ncbi:MAG: nucleoside-diphosphate kinase, partial [Candidatus Omnitrophica bacterium]|nr:nucleoside-diphosphate kinase [Candidatus Omnitrophota bacterium]
GRVRGDNEGKKEGTLRNHFGTEMIEVTYQKTSKGETKTKTAKKRANKVHASDSSKTVLRELRLMYSEAELLEVFTPEAVEYITGKKLTTPAPSTTPVVPPTPPAPVALDEQTQELDLNELSEVTEEAPVLELVIPATIVVDEQTQELDLNELSEVTEEVPTQEAVKITLEEVKSKKITFAMLKPDTEGKEDAIIAFIESKGFKVVSCIKRESILDKKTLQEFYKEHRRKLFFGTLVAFMMMKKVTVLVLCGPDDAHKEFRTVLGDTKGKTEGTLRYIFGTDRKFPVKRFSKTKGKEVTELMLANKVHASDSSKRVLEEVGLMHSDEELRGIFTPEAVEYIISKKPSDKKKDNKKERGPPKDKPTTPAPTPVVVPAGPDTRITVSELKEKGVTLAIIKADGANVAKGITEYIATKGKEKDYVIEATTTREKGKVTKDLWKRFYDEHKKKGDLLHQIVAYMMMDKVTLLILRGKKDTVARFG